MGIRRSQDKEVVCKDCCRPFTWLAAEGEFYADKGFSPPKRCPDCRAYLKRRAYGQQEARRQAEVQYD